MNALTFQLYRFSFWLAPLIGSSFVGGVNMALANPNDAWLTWWGVIVIYGAVPALDALLGQYKTTWTPEQQAKLARDPMLRVIPWVCAIVWFSILGYAISVFPQVLSLPTIHVIGFVMSLGVVGGITAINVGHELVHRNNKVERFLGGTLLASVCYGVFKVEHVRGHHLHVATEADPATARFGESIYAFLPRAIAGVYSHGWRIESESLGRAGHSGFARFIRNEVLHWCVLSLLVAGIAYASAGVVGLALYFGASFVAIVELEIVDYVEHYGLLRKRDANGQLERVSYPHSWDFSGWLTNGFLINLQRHADHHAHGGRAFGALSTRPEAPQLPASYAAMVLASLIPPLYRAIIHPRIASRAAASA
ncbi:MAG: alkane 1-monooxygenase [Casimicrobium sp.]